MVIFIVIRNAFGTGDKNDYESKKICPQFDKRKLRK